MKKGEKLVAIGGYVGILLALLKCAVENGVFD